jgi:hypothetical protein
MSAPDPRQWLRHGEHGGYFHCPVDAVADYVDLGWVRVDEGPVEISPVVAENLAAQETARLDAERAAAPQTSSKATKRTAPSSEGSE